MSRNLLLPLASILDTSRLWDRSRGSCHGQSAEKEETIIAEIIIHDLMKTGRTNDCHGAA